MTDATVPVPPQQVEEGRGWRLVDVATGRSYAIPPQGLVIGRTDTCDIVLASKGVSRRHAVIRPAGAGYSVTDESSNGTFVNDVRVQREQELARGDTLRVGSEEFRVEAKSRDGDATEALAAVSASTNHTARSQVEDDAGAAMASLEVLGGPLGGSRFVLRRPVCSIGKSTRNDIVVPDDTVSATHATLMQKAGAWYIVDLRSSNGTLVDGYRIAGERVLPSGSIVKLGDVKMVFRPVSRVRDEARGTAPVGGFLDRVAKLFRNR
jgi:pSer/pThr/pTyr-binding forkhead associated (FHA) protein